MIRIRFEADASAYQRAWVIICIPSTYDFSGYSTQSLDPLAAEFGERGRQRDGEDPKANSKKRFARRRPFVSLLRGGSLCRGHTARTHPQ